MLLDSFVTATLTWLAPRLTAMESEFGRDDKIVVFCARIEHLAQVRRGPPWLKYTDTSFCRVGASCGCSTARRGRTLARHYSCGSLLHLSTKMFSFVIQALLSLSKHIYTVFMYSTWCTVCDSTYQYNVPPSRTKEYSRTKKKYDFHIMSAS